MDQLIITLGICLERDHLMLSLVEFSPEIKQLTANWYMQPLQVVPGQSLPVCEPTFAQAITRFLTQAEIQIKQIDQVVLAIEDYIAVYPSFEMGLQDIVKQFSEIFPKESLYLARCDGYLLNAEMFQSVSAQEMPIYVCTGFVGSGFLGMKLIKRGLVLDIGDRVTRIIPIIDYKLDPDIRNHPPNYLQHTYAVRKRFYLGLKTPLREVMDEIATSESRYSLGPSALTVADFARLLDMGDEGTDPLRSSFLANREDSYRMLVTAVGLDMNLLDPEECFRLACSMYQQVVEKMAHSIERVLKVARLNPRLPLRALCVGSGYSLLARMALKLCGFKDEQMIIVKSSDYWQHWSNAGATYGLALMVAEKLANVTIEIDYELMSDPGA